MSDYTVRNEDGYAVTYDEDEEVLIRKGDLRAIMDVATGSMDFGSGFLDNEQVEALHVGAVILGIDKIIVTPSNFVCQYAGHHDWTPVTWGGGGYACKICRHHQAEQPTEYTPPSAEQLEIVRLKQELAEARSQSIVAERTAHVLKQAVARFPEVQALIINRLSEGTL